eukprot:6051633-Prymnesium_polylepis.1
MLSVYASGWLRAPGRWASIVRRSAAWARFASCVRRAWGVCWPVDDDPTKAYLRVFPPTVAMTSRLNGIGPYALERQWAVLQEACELTDSAQVRPRPHAATTRRPPAAHTHARARTCTNTHARSLARTRRVFAPVTRAARAPGAQFEVDSLRADKRASQRPPAPAEEVTIAKPLWKGAAREEMLIPVGQPKPPPEPEEGFAALDALAANASPPSAANAGMLTA